MARLADGSIKLAIKIRHKFVFFFPSLHTPNNCACIFHSITSLCHRRGNVNQQYGNCAIMKALIIIKVQAIISEGGKELVGGLLLFLQRPRH